MISINITHAAHIPERQATMMRLRESLLSAAGVPYHEETHVGPHWGWAVKGWQWSAEQDVSHCLFLQDDVLCMPELVNVVKAMTSALPDAIIALHSPHPGASLHCHQHRHPWYTSADNLVGTGYVLPRWVLQDFIEWREREIADVKAITEDTIITIYAMAHGRYIYHPVPSPIDHDHSVATTNDGGTREGRDDGGAFIRPMLPWWKLSEQDPEYDRKPLSTVEYWRPTSPIPHVGRTRRGNHWMLTTRLKRPLPLRAYQVEMDVTRMAPQ